VRIIVVALVAIGSAGVLRGSHPAAQVSAMPEALRFAVIGDNGTGDRFEYEVAHQMVAVRERFPFEMVLMLGDNIYGGQTPKDFVQKFEAPYRPLLEAGVRFYASLGNHDNQSNRFYKPFNMDGERYYTFAKRNVRFFVLDSDYFDDRQRSWINDALRGSRDEWKICYFHHPLYSNGGRHGAQVDLRVMLEPILTRYGVDVVFSGHDHVYERLKPQRGIHYFVSGAAGQVRKGNLRPSDSTAAGFDQDQSFMLVEVAGGTFSFQAISRTGQTVDSGVLQKGSRP